jgi:hypothetical protein
VVAHTHADPEIEEAIGGTHRFELVRKLGVGVDVATRLDVARGQNDRNGPRAGASRPSSRFSDPCL